MREVPTDEAKIFGYLFLFIFFKFFIFFIWFFLTAKENGLLFTETSALNAKNVDVAFIDLVKEIDESLKTEKIKEEKEQILIENLMIKKLPRKGYCCN